MRRIKVEQISQNHFWGFDDEGVEIEGEYETMLFQRQVEVDVLNIYNLDTEEEIPLDKDTYSDLCYQVLDMLSYDDEGVT